MGISFKDYYLKESLEGHHLYDLYATDFVRSFSSSEVQFSPEDRRQMANKKAEIMATVWREICADGISAIIGEIRHVWDDSDMPLLMINAYELEKALRKKYDTEKVMHGSIEKTIFTNPAKVIKSLRLETYFKSELPEFFDPTKQISIGLFAENILDFVQPDTRMGEISKVPQPFVRVIKTLFPNEDLAIQILEFTLDCYRFEMEFWNRKKTLSEVEDYIKKNFEGRMSIPEVLQMCAGIFGDIWGGSTQGLHTSIGWHGGYGGEDWAEIAETMSDFYQKGPYKITMGEIDHVLDLVHNTGSWLDKFPNEMDLIIALDDKYEANSPQQYRDKVTDPQVRKWLSKVIRDFKFRGQDIG